MKIVNSKLNFKRNQLGTRDLSAINLIVVHHTAGPQSQTIFDIHQAHLDNGWAGCGYHYVIDPMGIIYKGRKNMHVGAHCPGHNADSLGIALIGNFQEIQPPGEQVFALVKLIRELKIAYPKITKIGGHCDFIATACPGKFLVYELQRLGIFDRSL